MLFLLVDLKVTNDQDSELGISKMGRKPLDYVLLVRAPA